MNVEARLELIERRLGLLENGSHLIREDPPLVHELDLELPAGVFSGLRFNKTRVHATFTWVDGWYQSKDVLFISARRCVDVGSNVDSLSDYLNGVYFHNCLKDQLLKVNPYFIKSTVVLEVALPDYSQGIKTYNGVPCTYWMSSRVYDSPCDFCAVYRDGVRRHISATSLCGVALMFRVRG